MTPFAFDTLSASKRLREAGMEEDVAEAVVSVFQYAAAMPDISHLATKDDLDALRLATKDDLEAATLATKADIDALRLATKADIDALRVATKADIESLAASTKADIEGLRISTKADIDGLRIVTKADMSDLRADFAEKLRQQGWAMIGGTATVVAIATAIIKLVP